MMDSILGGGDPRVFTLEKPDLIPELKPQRVRRRVCVSF
jgi:hypothetical protein